MNIGIIVYSNTGHTLSVARELAQRLSADGHQSTLKELEVAGPVDPSATTAALKSRPAIDAYDALVLGTPVNGGRMSAALNGFLAGTPSLQGKRVALLLTHFFPWAWGAKQTIAQMTRVCQSKGAEVCGSGDVQWTSMRRQRQIATAVDRLASCFQA